MIKWYKKVHEFLSLWYDPLIALDAQESIMCWSNSNFTIKEFFFFFLMGNTIKHYQNFDFARDKIHKLKLKMVIQILQRERINYGSD